MEVFILNYSDIKKSDILKQRYQEITFIYFFIINLCDLSDSVVIIFIFIRIG